MAEPTNFCLGKSAYKWVEFLSWLQMVTHASHALLIFLIFRDKSISTTDTIWELFAFFLFGFIMGLILLRGARQKNRSWLTLWTVYASLMILVIVSLIFVISQRMGLSGTAAFIFLIPATLYAFSIWVVQILKNEITAEAVKAVHSHFALVMNLDPNSPCPFNLELPQAPGSSTGSQQPPAYENYEPPTYLEAIHQTHSTN